ncbi:MAG: hypothetical protein ACKOBR_10620 [Actinomycetota bacterium]
MASSADAVIVQVPENCIVICRPLVVHVLVVSLTMVTVASDVVVGAMLTGVVEKSRSVITANVIVWAILLMVIVTTFDSTAL